MGLVLDKPLQALTCLLKHVEPIGSIMQSQAALSAVYAVVALLRGLTFESNWCISHTRTGKSLESKQEDLAWDLSSSRVRGLGDGRYRQGRCVEHGKGSHHDS